MAPDDEIADTSAKKVTCNDLKNLRIVMENLVIVSPDLVHTGMHHSKLVYARYRECFMVGLFKKLFTRGQALAGRKLALIRYLFAVLRLAYAGKVRDKLRAAYAAALEKGASDPRLEALVALLDFHIQLAAMWERLTLHGPHDLLRSMMPHMFLVRFLHSPP